jgi:hypothetical protein
MEAAKTHLHFFELTTEQGFTILGWKADRFIHPSSSSLTNSSHRKVGLLRADRLLGLVRLVFPLFTFSLFRALPPSLKSSPPPPPPPGARISLVHSLHGGEVLEEGFFLGA